MNKKVYFYLEQRLKNNRRCVFPIF